MEPKQPLISVVIPGLNEADCLPELYAELCRSCDPLPYRFEFLFVDDGSTDETVAVLTALNRQDPRVRFLSFSRNFGNQAALSAGLANAGGDAVITMDADLQHPPALIPQFLECWQAGYDVVNSLRQDTEGISPIRKMCSSVFNSVFNWITNMQVAQGAAALPPHLPGRARRTQRLARTPSLSARPGLLGRLPADEHSLRRPASLRRQHQVVVHQAFAALDGRHGVVRLFATAALVGGRLVGHGCERRIRLPGRAAVSVVGLAAPGWLSLAVFMIFLASFQSAALGMLGEYVGRILEQVKGRPLYIAAPGGLANVVRFPAADTNEPAPVIPVPVANQVCDKRLTG